MPGTQGKKGEGSKFQGGLRLVGPPCIPSPRGMLSRDCGLLLDTRNTVGVSGNVFESLPARAGRSSALLESSLNLASSSCVLGSSDTGNIMEH